MKKVISVVVFVLSAGFGSAGFASDAQFRQMEEKKVFEKIRTKMIMSCYTQGKTPQVSITTLEQLKSLYPQRAQSCACFQAALARVSNRTIYEDSKHSYQLYVRKKDALKLNNTALLKEVEAQINAFEPFMSKIIKKCGLSQ